MFSFYRFIIILIAGFGLMPIDVAQAQSVAQYSSEVAIKHYQLALQLVKTTPGFTPPVVSRALGYTGLTLYEAMVPGMSDYQSADGIIVGLGPGAITDRSGSYHYPTVANNALATIIDSLFANTSAANRTLLHNLRDSLNAVYQTQTTVAIYSNSLAFGQTIAQDIFDYSRTDGGHKGYTTNFPPSYVVPTGQPWYWQSTPTAFQAIPLQPYWGNNTPFVPANATALPPIPVQYSDVTGSDFYNYANQVYNSKPADGTDQSNIALFWADGGGTVTPPGHSISMLTQLLTANNENLEFATLAYAKMGMGVMDAFIQCWNSKYTHFLKRPVTYIQANIDAAWTPLIATPPFPEYSSGHSTQSGAFASIMTGLYGPTYSFTDNTHGALFGGPRTFNSFDAASEEAAVSRLYGGIHYEFSNELGKIAGKEIGANINELFATQLRVAPLTDASLEIDFSTTQAEINGQISITIYLRNDGLTELNNINIAALLPTSLAWQNHTADIGTYDPNTGVWSIAQVPAGTAAVALTIQAVVVTAGVPFVQAEITAMTEPDSDSVPNNQDLSEDDYTTGCISVAIRECQISYNLEAPTGYTSYEWFSSTDNGTTFNSFATTRTVAVTQAGQYVFVVEGAILGSCGNQLCCPVIIEKNCCPIPVCIPMTVRRN